LVVVELLVRMDERVMVTDLEGGRVAIGLGFARLRNGEGWEEWSES
jgi:hypothetical protein